MARKKTVKKYTLAEFKAWLEGVEEIQPATWSPDNAQWKMIRQKIDAIVEEVVERVVEREVQYQQTPQQSVVPQPSVEQEFVSPADAWTAPPSLPVESAIPDITPAAAAALSGKLPSSIVTDATGNGKSVTPNIDTSKGSYASDYT